MRCVFSTPECSKRLKRTRPYPQRITGKIERRCLGHAHRAQQRHRPYVPDLCDTRFAPDREAVFRYRQARDPKAKMLALRVRVRPDEFYSNFYRALLEGGAGEGEAMIRKALAAAIR